MFDFTFRLSPNRLAPAGNKFPRSKSAAPFLLVALLMSACFLSMAWPPPAAQAATTRVINVDPVADDNPGGSCTLREALDLANAGAGAGLAANDCLVVENGTGPPLAYQINLPAYTYTLTGTAGDDTNAGGDLDILANVTLTGAGAANTIIDGNRIDRVFDLPTGGFTVVISEVTIQNGYVVAGGGGGVRGGGVRNTDSTLTISNCEITDNEAEGFAINQTGSGGGVANAAGVTTIANSVITNNRTRGSVNAAGAGLRNSSGVMNIINSTISNNTAVGSCCGGVYNASGGTLNILNSAITANRAQRSDTFGGGGLLNENSTANIANTTISGNFAHVDGGGVYTRRTNRPTTLNLTNVTITNNVADADDNGSGGGGGLAIESTQAQDHVVNIKNSIIAGNIDRGGQSPDVGRGRFSSAGNTPLNSFRYNLIGDVGNYDFADNGTGDLYGDPNNTTTPRPGATEFPTPIDPLLAGLTGNPAVHPLQPGSPALDHIPAGTGGQCTFLSFGTNPLFDNGEQVAIDQPGTPRPQGADCDIGAFELPVSADVQIVKSVRPPVVSAGGPLTYTLTFTNAGPGPAAGVVITDLIPVTLTNVSVLSGGAVMTNTGIGPGFVWTVEDLGPAQGGFIIITGQMGQIPTGHPPLVNTAAITTSAIDPDPSNNDSSASVEVVAAQLLINKTVTPTTVAVQEPATYTITLSNPTRADIANTQLTDRLPLSTTFAGWVQQPAGAAVTAGQLTWTGTVAAGQATTFVFRVDQTGQAGQAITNTAEYSAPGGGGSDSAVFTVTPAPVLPNLTIADVTLFEGDAGLTEALFPVSLSAASAAPITVAYTTLDGTAAVTDADYLTAAAAITFSPGQTSQTIPVAIQGDTKVEPDETFFLTLSGGAGATIADDQAVGLILNDDAVSPPAGDEGRDEDNDGDDDDRDSDSEPSPPPAAAPPPPAAAPPAATDLPVAFLPETGRRSATRQAGWLFLAAIAAGGLIWIGRWRG